MFFAGQKKLHEWSAPPYALDMPTSQLAGVEFVRASVTDDTNYEASDLLFLNGERFSEEIEVNLVELPVMVTDSAGAAGHEPQAAGFHRARKREAAEDHQRSTTPRTCRSRPAC